MAPGKSKGACVLDQTLAFFPLTLSSLPLFRLREARERKTPLFHTASLSQWELHSIPVDSNSRRGPLIRNSKKRGSEVWERMTARQREEWEQSDFHSSWAGLMEKKWCFFSLLSISMMWAFYLWILLSSWLTQEKIISFQHFYSRTPTWMIIFIPFHHLHHRGVHLFYSHPPFLTCCLFPLHIHLIRWWFVLNDCTFTTTKAGKTDSSGFSATFSLTFFSLFDLLLRFLTHSHERRRNISEVIIVFRSFFSLHLLHRFSWRSAKTKCVFCQLSFTATGIQIRIRKKLFECLLVSSPVYPIMHFAFPSLLLRMCLLIIMKTCDRVSKALQSVLNVAWKHSADHCIDSVMQSLGLSLQSFRSSNAFQASFHPLSLFPFVFPKILQEDVCSWCSGWCKEFRLFSDGNSFPLFFILEGKE